MGAECLRRRTSTHLQGGTCLLRDTGAKAKSSRSGRCVRGASRALPCADRSSAESILHWICVLGVCTGTCGAAATSAVDVHTHRARGDAAVSVLAGFTAICHPHLSPGCHHTSCQPPRPAHPLLVPAASAVCSLGKPGQDLWVQGTEVCKGDTGEPLFRAGSCSALRSTG